VSLRLHLSTMRVRRLKEVVWNEVLEAASSLQVAELYA
jgi:hypothetical protein